MFREAGGEDFKDMLEERKSVIPIERR